MIQQLLVLVVITVVVVSDSQSIVDLINNNPQATWNAEENHISKLPLYRVKRLMGTRVVRRTRYTDEEMAIVYKHEYDNDNSLPDSFDAREKWPKCIHKVRDQGHCGSCWAFAASEAASDRFCVYSNASVNVVLSPQDMVSCSWLNMGCNGGLMSTAWLYLWITGIVPDSCLPYQSAGGDAPSCPSTCSTNSTISVKSDKYHMKVVYPVGTIINFWNRERLIQNEIYTGGAVEAAFSVYADFLGYKSGVYQHVTGEYLGGHAVKMIGKLSLN
jgi:cathepsin B